MVKRRKHHSRAAPDSFAGYAGDEAEERALITDNGRFLVTDSPEEANAASSLVTHAPQADIAVVLVDAKEGIVTRTRRHSHLVALLGLKRVVLVVNKMDRIDFDQVAFSEIDSAYRTYAGKLGIQSVITIPLSGRDGDNLFQKSERTPWYQGPTLIEALEQSERRRNAALGPLRLPVESLDLSEGARKLSGQIVSGRAKPGDEILVCPAEKPAKIEKLFVDGAQSSGAETGDRVILTLDRDVEATEGDILATASSPAQHTDQFAAHVVWMHEDALLPERQYLIKVGQLTTTAQITRSALPRQRRHPG